MLKDVRLDVYEKNGKGWALVNTITDPARVYECLASQIRAKYIWKAGSVRRIEEGPAYTEHGGRRTTVYQDNGIKLEFLTD